MKIQNGRFKFIRTLLFFNLLLVFPLACSAPEKRLTGWAKVYEDCKELFGRVDFERASDYAREIALASPRNDYSEKGQVMGIILLSGLAQGYRSVGEAYGEGVDNLKNPEQKGHYRRMRTDAYQYARTHVLHFAEVARQFIKSYDFEDDTGMDDVVVECPYPSAELPLSNPHLKKAKNGEWITSENQIQGQKIALRMQTERSLAGAVGVEASKVGEALQSGTATILRVEFNLYLAEELLRGAQIFGENGLDDSRKLLVLCDQADASLSQALKALDETPNDDLKKRSRDIEKKLKKILSGAGYGLSRNK